MWTAQRTVKYKYQASTRNRQALQVLRGVTYRARFSLRILAAEWTPPTPWMRWVHTEWWGWNRRTECVDGCGRWTWCRCTAPDNSRTSSRSALQACLQHPINHGSLRISSFKACRTNLRSQHSHYIVEKQRTLFMSEMQQKSSHIAHKKDEKSLNAAVEQ